MLWKNAPQTLETSQNFFLTPIFIQNFNQLSYLKRLIDWLLAAGYKNICIIDNNSTYVPLLEYYTKVETSFDIQVVRRDENGTRTTLWEAHLLECFGVTGPFVYTDSDIIPDACCPADIIGRLASYLRDYQQILKVGPGLRIDNLPNYYRFRDDVVTWEKQFWLAPVCRGAFLSLIDTTFALYRPNSTFALGPALRTGWPYLARHETWYQDSDSLSEEQRYYASEVEKTLRGHWARRRLPGKLQDGINIRAKWDAKLLHLGCGHQTIPGWINLDRNPAVAADIVFDLETCADKKLPIGADSVDGFYMCHAFQEVDAILPMMQELHRVAKPGARFIMRLPHGATDEASTNPANRRLYFPDSFAYFSQSGCAEENDDYVGDWSVERLKLLVRRDLIESEGELQVLQRVRREWNIVEEMIVELRAVKPPRPRRLPPSERITVTFTDSPFDAESDFRGCSPV